MADPNNMVAGLFGGPAPAQRPSQQQIVDAFRHQLMVNALRDAYFKKTLDKNFGGEFNDQPTIDQQVRSLFANPANIGTFKGLESDMESKLAQPWWNIAPYQDPKGI